jgi:hypothetical protein
MTDQPQSISIEIGSQSLTISGGKVELWKYGTHAPAWFADAQKEAELEDDHAKRREIVFAVCAVESYLFEWVREVLNGEFRRLNHYFPPSREGRGVGIVERWKQVLNHLHEDGTITRKPTFGEDYWEEFRELVDFRNGLVHGRASRPETEGQSDPEKPEPTWEQLAQKQAGWAVNVVVEEVIRKLHEAVGTTPPDWLRS